MSFFGGIKSVVGKALGLDNVVDAGLKIVEKLAGTDWTPKDKSEFLLEYMEKTKYQSKTRRVIAVVMLLEWALMVNVWLIASIFENKGLSSSIEQFMQGNINVGITAIMSFYFLLGLKK